MNSTKAHQLKLLYINILNVIDINKIPPKVCDSIVIHKVKSFFWGGYLKLPHLPHILYILIHAVPRLPGI